MEGWREGERDRPRERGLDGGKVRGRRKEDVRERKSKAGSQ